MTIPPHCTLELARYINIERHFPSLVPRLELWTVFRSNLFPLWFLENVFCLITPDLILKLNALKSNLDIPGFKTYEKWYHKRTECSRSLSAFGGVNVPFRELMAQIVIHLSRRDRISKPLRLDNYRSSYQITNPLSSRCKGHNNYGKQISAKYYIY